MCGIVRNYPAYTLDRARRLSYDELNGLIDYLRDEQGESEAPKKKKALTVPITNGDIGAALKKLERLRKTSPNAR